MVLFARQRGAGAQPLVPAAVLVPQIQPRSEERDAQIRERLARAEDVRSRIHRDLTAQPESSGTPIRLDRLRELATQIASMRHDLSNHAGTDRH
jgi:hypothetical protein